MVRASKHCLHSRWTSVAVARRRRVKPTTATISRPGIPTRRQTRPCSASRPASAASFGDERGEKSSHARAFTTSVRTTGYWKRLLLRVIPPASVALRRIQEFPQQSDKNPCPVYLQAQHSGLNADRPWSLRPASCGSPIVVEAYVALIKAAAARYNDNPRIEGLILQESALQSEWGLFAGCRRWGDLLAEAWRDALIELVGQCGAAFSQGHCMAFMNFIRGGQPYLYDVSAAIAAVPGNGACMSGPDLRPDNHPSTGRKRACTRSSRGTTAVAQTVPRTTPSKFGAVLGVYFSIRSQRHVWGLR